ncbi:pyridoxal phosphate-dependent aminotransferase [Peribacillus sp. NPDC097295]|uniref:pyridoxal phosphate-dependent aminotransferase n=1 Tax=Peribacillus sp. NPDC097295 TaxID=3364402 RepID=UPI0037F882F6
MGIYENRLIRLDFGEPSFPCPPEAKAESIKYISSPNCQYAPIKGDRELIFKIKTHLQEQYSIQIDEQYVTITTGGLMGLNAIIRCLKNNGITKVYYPNPGFPPYQFMGHYNGINMEPYPMVEEEQAIRQLCLLAKESPMGKTAFLITSPNNPNGLTFSRDSWDLLLEAMDKHFIICDHSFESFIFHSQKQVTIPLRENVFHAFSFSKTYSLADYRVGYVISPSLFWSEEISREHWFSQLSTSVISQKAALGALNSPQDYKIKNKRMVLKNIQKTIDLLRASDIEISRPDGGFFLWINIEKTGLSSEKFVEVALVHYKLSLISGANFGSEGEGYIRINCAADPVSLQEGISRFITCYNERLKKYEYTL